MGLLSILRKIKEKEREIRILILGLDNAGKTTVCKRLCGQDIDQIEPTLGFNIQTLQHQSPTNNGAAHDSSYTIHLWDVGGQSTIRAYWRNYFEATDGLIWVVDSVDALRLDLCRAELRELLGHEKLAGASLLILANKQDAPGAVTLQEIQQALELGGGGNDDNTTSDSGDGDDKSNNNDEENNIMANRHWSIRPCSAVTGQGLVEAMDWLVDDIGSRIFLLS